MLANVIDFFDLPNKLSNNLLSWWKISICRCFVVTIGRGIVIAFRMGEILRNRLRPRWAKVLATACPTYFSLRCEWLLVLPNFQQPIQCVIAYKRNRSNLCIPAKIKWAAIQSGLSQSIGIQCRAAYPTCPSCLRI